MAIVKNLIPVQFIGLHHIVLYRAFFHKTLNLADIADRYLETGRDLVQARHALLKTQDALLTIGRRNNLSHEELALIMLPPSIRRRASEVEKLIKKLKKLQKEYDEAQDNKNTDFNIISFEDFIEQFDPEGYLGEEEQLQAYYAEIGHNYQSPVEEVEREKLRFTDYMLGYPEESDDEVSPDEAKRLEEAEIKLKRRLIIINKLADQLVKTPSVKDPVEGWFHPNVADRLIAGNLFTIGQVIQRINTFGWNWFKDVPKLGKLTANKIKTWINANADFLEDQIHPFAMKPQKESAILVVNHKKDLMVIDNNQDQVIVRQTGFVPMEILKVPELLDGSQGVNRAHYSLNKLKAINDYEAICEWLSLHEGKTNLSYKKEAERLLLWSIMNLRKPFSSLNVADIVAYRAFLKDPQPEHLWIGKRRLARTHPHWKPFTSKLSDSSITYSLTVLNGMFEFLASQQYLQSNPIRAIPKNMRTKRTTTRVSRLIPVRLWQLVEEKIANTAIENTIEYRTAFLIKLLYMTGLRLEEVSNIKLGDFFAIEKDSGEKSWRLKVIGKGSKERDIIIVDVAYNMISEYLIKKGLKADPRLNEKTSSLFTHIEDLTPLSAKRLYDTIKEWFYDLAQPIKDSDPVDYELLKNVSTHWLRHTFATRLAKKADLAIVKNMLGHSSLQTTSIYISAEDEESEKAMADVFS